MQTGRGLILAVMLAVVSGQALAVTKCQSGGKTLYTEAPACPVGYVNATPSLDGTLPTAGASDAGHQQQSNTAESSPGA